MSNKNFLLRNGPRLAPYFQLLTLFTYTFFSVSNLNFQRPRYALVAAVLSALLSELILRRLSKQRIPIPTSALIAGTSFYLLVESPNINLYLLGGALCSLGKFIFRTPEGHIFNPSNLGVIIVTHLALTPVVAVPAQWGGHGWLLVYGYLMGVVTTFLAGRLQMPIAYMLTFIVASLIRSAIQGVNPLLVTGVIIGIPQTLFIFHMITDPKTSPRPFKASIAFAALVAILDVLLRSFEILYAPFVSLIIITACWHMIRYLKTFASESPVVLR